MMKRRACIVIFVFCVITQVYSSVLESSHREKLREIRNVCAVQSGLGPFDVGSIIRAIRPAEKLVNTTQCIVKTLVEQRDQDEIVNEILQRLKVVFEFGILPKTIKHVIASCEAIVGVDSCQRLINLAELIIESVRRNNLTI